MINVNQITSQLAKMPDQLLQKFAAMHKNDPYTVSLALSESNRRKDLRTSAQAKMAGQAMPKVVDQEVAQMAAVDPMGNVTGALPEDVGIGQLPAQNLRKLAGGGIVAFDEGGEVPRFQNRGEVKSEDGPEQYRAYALKKAEAMGLDPIWVDRILSHESKYDPNAVSPTGATGIGQLVKNTANHYMRKVGHLGLQDKFDPEIRKDPYKNMDASLAYMADLQKKYKGDPRLMAVAYNQGETYLDKHLKENQGQLNPAGLKAEPKNYLQKTVEAAIPSAEAAPVRPKLAEGEQLSPDGKTVLDARGIPLRSASAVSGASPEAKDTRTYFGKLADTIGIPEEYQRNISNTLNALGGYSSPVAMVRGAGAASKALEPTAEMIQKAEQLKGIAATPRLTPPVPGGIAALDEAAQATRAAAEGARRARALEADVQAAKGAEQSVEAASKSAQTAANLEKAIAAGPREAALNAAKVANTGRALSMDRAIDMASTEGTPKVTPVEEGGAEGAPKVEKEGIEKLIEASKGATPEAGGNKYKDEMALQFFLGLMGGQSPNAFTNVSQAGLGALKYGQEAKKEESDRLYKEALAKHYGVDPFVQRLKALQDPENMQMFKKMKELEREPMTREKLYTAFMSSPTAMGLMADPEKLNAAFKNYVQMYEDNLGPIGGGQMPGFKVLGSRPAG